MAWLTITAGPTGTGSWDGDVQEDGAQEGEPFRVGAEVRAYGGNLRSTVRSLARNWKLKTPPITADDLATLAGVIGLGPCTMSGVITGGASIAVSVKRTGVTLMKDGDFVDDTGFIVSLEIQEVNPLPAGV